MNEQAALLRAIRAAPDDDTARLVYADWLDEHADAARAEFIRAQIELARCPRGGACHTDCRPPGFAGCPLADLRRRERELFDAGWLPDTGGLRAWHFGPLGAVPGNPFCYAVRRGFVAAAMMSTPDWLRHGDAIVAEHPVTEVVLTTVPSFGQHDRELTYPRDRDGRVLAGVAGEKKLFPFDMQEWHAGDRAHRARLVLSARYPGVRFEFDPPT